MLVSLTVATQDIGLLVFSCCLLGILTGANFFKCLQAHLFFRACMTILHSYQYFIPALLTLPCQSQNGLVLKKLAGGCVFISYCTGLLCYYNTIILPQSHSLECDTFLNALNGIPKK